MSVSLIDGHIDDEMTDEQIIKALEYCVTYEFCTGCPLVNNCPSSYSLLKSGLDLINRQKAEIEALVAGQETLQKNLAKAIKSEAEKEFAEELIYKIVNTPTKFESTHYMYRDGIAFRQNEIIDIIKEMAGDGT